MKSEALTKAPSLSNPSTISPSVSPVAPRRTRRLLLRTQLDWFDAKPLISWWELFFCTSELSSTKMLGWNRAEISRVDNASELKTDSGSSTSDSYWQPGPIVVYDSSLLCVVIWIGYHPEIGGSFSLALANGYWALPQMSDDLGRVFSCTRRTISYHTALQS